VSPTPQSFAVGTDQAAAMNFRSEGRSPEGNARPRAQAQYFRLRRSLLQTVDMLADKLCAAINAHDIDAFMVCLDEGYDSAQPVHPGREFHGAAQARTNWTRIFSEVPDVHAELLAKTEDSGVEWAEWYWHGTRTDGTTFQMRGMTIAGVRTGRIGWQRLYMDEVEQTAESIDAAVQNLTHT
jgi:hypothetical protein